MGFSKRNNKVVPLDQVYEEEREKKKGAFDGISPDYVNDWCLIGYVIAIALEYIIFFIYLPIKAQANREWLMTSDYAAITLVE